MQREIGQEPGQLAAPGAEAFLEGLDVCHAQQELQQFDEGPIRRVDDRPGGSIQDERAAVSGLVSKLANEPGLAAAGLASDQRDATALAPLGEREQLA